MMKMLFVDPATEIAFNYPNIGLAYAATQLNVKVIDQHTLPYPQDRFLKHKVDVLGISVRSLTLKEAQRIARLYKKKYPDVEIVSVRNGIDVQCCYPYLDFKKQVFIDKPFSDAYPFPHYELFDSFRYLQACWSSGLWDYTIVTSVGCPYQCTFCASHNRKWYPRSAQNCYQELKQAKEKYNIKGFEIIDDCFNLNKRRVIEFANLVARLKLRWECSNGLRADLFDEETASAMKISGCELVGFGVESVNPKVLQIIKKGETLDQIEKAILIAKKYWQKVHGFFIIGLPGATYEDDLQALEWARSRGISAIFSYYVPSAKVVSGESNAFYGEKAHLWSKEYPQELQKKVYQFSRMKKKKEYLAIGRLGRIVFAVFAMLFHLSPREFPTHFIRVLKKMLSIFLYGEVQ